MALIADVNPDWLNVLMNVVQLATMALAGIGIALGYKWRNGWAKHRGDRRKGGHRRKDDRKASTGAGRRQKPPARSRQKGEGK